MKKSDNSVTLPVQVHLGETNTLKKKKKVVSWVTLPVQVHLGKTNTHEKVGQLGHFTREGTPGRNKHTRRHKPAGSLYPYLGGTNTHGNVR